MKIPTFERRNEIIRMLQEHGYVKAQMLAKQYQVSMETIRKDLTWGMAPEKRKSPAVHLAFWRMPKLFFWMPVRRCMSWQSY